MILEKRQFAEGMDGDTGEKLLSDKACLNVMNARMSVSEYGRDGRLENIPGTIQISEDVLPPYGTNMSIGKCVDLARGRIIRLVSNTFGDHGIYATDVGLGITYPVLYDSQVEGGLNFNKNFLIHSARVVGDLLIWPNGSANEIKKINIEAGIKLNRPGYITSVVPYEAPIKYVMSTLIKRPPTYRLQIAKTLDQNFPNNYIKNNAYQFVPQFRFRDSENSALGSYSSLAPYNFSAETSNCVAINFSLSEKIDADIQFVDVCVKYGNFGKTAIVKTWDRNNPADAAAFAAHNAGTTPLGFTFYDDVAGIFLDDVSANTPFDDVPLTAGSMEYNFRLFFSDPKLGYNTPSVSSLTASVTTVNTGVNGNFPGTWGYITLHANFCNNPGAQDTYNFPFVRSLTAPNLFYYFSSVRNSTIWNGGVGSVPSTINLNDATFSGNTEAAIIDFLKNTQYPYSPSGLIPCSPTWQVPYEVSYDSLGPVTLYSFSSVQIQQFFKSSSTYQINIAFYDRYRRKCGVVKNVKVVIPTRTYNQTQFVNGILWGLNNTNALNEIPDWAYFYQIHVTRNLTTRFFVQAQAKDATYVLRNQDGTYTYGNAAVSTSTYAIGIDVSYLTGVGMGYTFTEGDLVRLHFSPTTNYLLSVIGQDGNWVLVAPFSVGTLNSSTAILFDLYTPYKQSGTEPYYETGEVLDISSPGTVNRSYSVLTGTINGDTYALDRINKNNVHYIVEAMSPNDNVWKIWQTDTGWVNYVDHIGQRQKHDTFVFSDTYLLGTASNGLNKFQPLNTDVVGAESGTIQKLQIVNKQEEDGNVMLAICTNQTSSIYLGEARITDSTGATQFFSKTQGVIGTINALKGTYGTIHPEAVCEYLGLAFWPDTLKGRFVQYSNNGLDDVGYKMGRFFKRYFKNYLATPTATLDAINGFHHITTSVDPASKEVLVVLPGLIYDNYAATLPSYASIPSYTNSVKNRFDIYDGLGKTMSFKYEKNQWGNDYEFMPEGLVYIQNRLFGLQSGNIFKHNEDIVNWNKFYGVFYPMRICVTANLNGSALKELCNIAVEGNAAPDWCVALATYPDEQITDLVLSEFDDNQGFFYADFKCDRLSPNVSGSVIQKMHKGDLLTDVAIKVMCEFQAYTKLTYVDCINLGYQVSAGHKRLLTPINR